MNLELSTRAYKCKHFRWLPGMRWLAVAVDDDGIAYFDGGEGRAWCEQPKDEAVPDLDDPATIGGLLALVRKAWGDPGIGIRRRTSGAWQVIRPGSERSICTEDTEAEALVAALENAP